MGSLCSCFRVADVEDLEESSASNHTNCNCPSCLTESFKYKCGAFFGRVDRPAVLSSANGASSSSMVSPNIAQLDAYSNAMAHTKSQGSIHKDIVPNDTNSSSSDKNMQTRINLQKSSRLVTENESKVHHSEDDEDVCPTCLEDYTLENPKIVIQCRHSYHLSCIYEWMERSEKCPMCGKVMLFEETAQATTA